MGRKIRYASRRLRGEYDVRLEDTNPATADGGLTHIGVVHAYVELTKDGRKRRRWRFNGWAQDLSYSSRARAVRRQLEALGIDLEGVVI